MGQNRDAGTVFLHVIQAMDDWLTGLFSRHLADLFQEGTAGLVSGGEKKQRGKILMVARGRVEKQKQQEQQETTEAKQKKQKVHPEERYRTIGSL